MTIEAVFREFRGTVKRIIGQLEDMQTRVEATFADSERLKSETVDTIGSFDQRLERIEQNQNELRRAMDEQREQVEKMKIEVDQGLQTLNETMKTFNEFTQQRGQGRDDQLDELLDLLKRRKS